MAARRVPAVALALQACSDLVRQVGVSGGPYGGHCEWERCRRCSSSHGGQGAEELAGGERPASSTAEAEPTGRCTARPGAGRVLRSATGSAACSVGRAQIRTLWARPEDPSDAAWEPKRLSFLLARVSRTDGQRAYVCSGLPSVQRARGSNRRSPGVPSPGRAQRLGRRLNRGSSSGSPLRTGWR